MINTYMIPARGRKYSMRVRSWHRRVLGIEKDSSILFRFCTLAVASSYSHRKRRQLTAQRQPYMIQWEESNSKIEAQLRSRPQIYPRNKANDKIQASKDSLQTFVLRVKCMRNIGPPTMSPALPRSVYRPTNRYFLHHGFTRFCALQTTENPCVEPFLAMASRTKTLLPFDAENTGYDDEKSFSTAPRSCQKLTSVDAGDSFFLFCM